MQRPVLWWTPDPIAVYAPGASAIRIAESLLFGAKGNAPTRTVASEMAAAFSSVVQPALKATLRLWLSTIFSMGAARVPLRPNDDASVGPAARTRTCLGWSPVITK